MRTFAELLTEYTRRTGVNDSELARSIGVQRQTIFRWKEGTVARPRFREDVLRIATKLRLTPVERDELLLAAGFPPEHMTLPPEFAVREGTANAGLGTLPLTEATSGPEAEPHAAPDALSTPGHSATFPVPQPKPSRRDYRPGLLLGAGGLLLLLLALGGTWALPRLLGPGLSTPTAALAASPVATAPAAVTPALLVARPGEKLLLVAPFVGYTASDQRFNVAGRIREALEEEVRESKLSDTRVAVLPEALVDGEDAFRTLVASQATAVIWGEYDAGRVRASVTLTREQQADWVNPLDSVAKLPLTINEKVPSAARVFALFALGRVYRQEGDATRALAAFEKALALNPTDTPTTAALHFYVGSLLPEVRGATTSTLGAAIEHYTLALTLEPEWENVLYNRGTSHLGRALLTEDSRADLDAAIADLEKVVARNAQRLEPLLNRGIAYYERHIDQDLTAASADFTAAIRLAPADYRPYYHRGLARLRSGVEGWDADLQQALTLEPGYVWALNALCWGYGLTRQPEKGLPFCEEAVANDATGASRDGRAIVYAQLGRNEEAADDLAAYVTWVKATYPDLFVKFHGPEAERWQAELEAGRNPFDDPVLAKLRQG